MFGSSKKKYCVICNDLSEETRNGIFFLLSIHLYVLEPNVRIFKNLKHIMSNTTEVKCVVTGDGGVGKTCTLVTYAQGAFPVEYTPTIFDNHEVRSFFFFFFGNVRSFSQRDYDKQVYVDINMNKVKLNLCDTAGQEDYDRLRPLSYTNTDILLILFDLETRESFENVLKRWIPEAKEHTTCPWVLVGTKCDSKTHEVSFEEANKFAEEHGAKFYIEISALRGDNMKQLFDRCVRVALDNKVSTFQHTLRRKKYRFVHNHNEDTCRVACKTGCIVS